MCEEGQCDMISATAEHAACLLFLSPLPEAHVDGTRVRDHVNPSTCLLPLVVLFSYVCERQLQTEEGRSMTSDSKPPSLPLRLLSSAAPPPPKSSFSRLLGSGGRA